MWIILQGYDSLNDHLWLNKYVFENKLTGTIN